MTNVINPFMTQTLSDIGLDYEGLCGMFFIEVSPTTNQGYGRSRAFCLEEAMKVFMEKYPKFIGVNVKLRFYYDPNTHPSYNREVLEVIGDLVQGYVMDTPVEETKPDDIS